MRPDVVVVVVVVVWLDDRERLLFFSRAVCFRPSGRPTSRWCQRSRAAARRVARPLLGYVWVFFLFCGPASSGPRTRRHGNRTGGTELLQRRTQEKPTQGSREEGERLAEGLILSHRGRLVESDWFVMTADRHGRLTLSELQETCFSCCRFTFTLCSLPINDLYDDTICECLLTKTCHY